MAKRKKKASKQAKERLKLALLWGRRGVLVLCVLAFALWCMSWFVLSEADEVSARWMHDKVMHASIEMGFGVENILVEGRKYTDSSALLGLINVEQGDSIFLFNPREAKSQIEKIGWVKSARVERRLPGTIYIKLTEREPTAFWQDGESLHLIDSEGVRLTQKNLQAFKHLPMIRGKEAPEKFSKLHHLLLAEPDLISMLDHAELVDKRRWNLYLKDGKRIKLPESDVADAVRHLMLRQEQDKILTKEVITDIDARYTGRLIVKTKLGKVQDYKAGITPIGTAL